MTGSITKPKSTYTPSVTSTVVFALTGRYDNDFVDKPTFDADVLNPKF